MFARKINIEKIKKKIDSLIWYHTLELDEGLVTPGIYDHRPYLDYYGIPEDLKGKRVLDIGAASGFFTFELEKRGAQVVATELPSWFDHDVGPKYVPDKPLEVLEKYLHEPFLLAKKILKSKAKLKKINIYDLSPKKIGKFDLVFCGSLLLHLTDPVQALWRIASVTKEMAIIATAIFKEEGKEEIELKQGSEQARDDSRKNKEVDAIRKGRENVKENCEEKLPFAHFVGEPGGISWWIPNKKCLEAWIECAGFSHWRWYSSFRLDYSDGKPGTWHGVVHCYP